jgi:hypothetical protein
MQAQTGRSTDVEPRISLANALYARSAGGPGTVDDASAAVDR